MTFLAEDRTIPSLILANLCPECSAPGARQKAPQESEDPAARFGRLQGQKERFAEAVLGKAQLHGRGQPIHGLQRHQGNHNLPTMTTTQKVGRPRLLQILILLRSDQPGSQHPILQRKTKQNHDLPSRTGGSIDTKKSGINPNRITQL